MIGSHVKQVVVRICHILGHFQVPARCDGSQAKQSQESLEPRRFHIKGISGILIEGPCGCTVDSQALSGREVNDSLNSSRDQRKGWRLVGLIGISHVDLSKTSVRPKFGIQNLNLI